MYRSPAPKAVHDGISFPLPFAQPLFFLRKTKDRVVWDRPVKFDLSRSAAFELTLFCSHPDAVRAMGLYVKSGEGWYVADAPLRHAGAQTLTFYKSDFTTQGRVAGWNHIDGLRLSPWRGTLPRNTSLVMQRLTALESEAIVVVQGTSSCPDAGEKAVAAKTADRVSRLLIEAGLEHRLATDEDVAAGALGQARVALLPYNPKPSAKELTALRAFMGRGGKLGVFYGTSAPLAQSMGFRLGGYVKSTRPDRWRGIAFLNSATWGLPERIGQNSQNLYTIEPAESSAQIVATWLDSQGRVQPEAAIVLSPRGFWMSHILQNDNRSAKREMLVALCAQLAPELWIPAARRAILQAGQINEHASLPQTLAAIRRQLPNALHPAVTETLLKSIESIAAEIPAAMTGGRPRDAYRMARRQRQLLLHADASVQTSRPGEFIGVWDHEGTGLIPGQWPATIHELTTGGVNALFVNVAWGGQAHYPSKYLPGSASLRLYGDSLAQCLAAAKPNGLQVHAWIVLWKLDNAPADFSARMKKEGRLQITSTGGTRPWLSPHHPENRTLMWNALEEMARNYPALTGIHLDYIRLPDSLSCYAPTTRQRFELAIGKKAAKWPADVLANGSLHTAFLQWRANDISAFVAEARRRLRLISPTLQLSCAVYGAPAPHGGNIAQDWPAWLRNGWVDFLTPMNYTESASEFASRIQRQLVLPGARGRIIPGIGVTADESRLDAAAVARQIQLARQAGCPGIVLFSLNDTLTHDILPVLRQGILRP